MTPPFLPGEIALLKAINGAHSPYWDAVMYLISNVGAWAYPALALLIFLFWKRPKQEALLILLMIGLCIAIGDGLSSWLAKPFFARFRPTHTPGLAEQLHQVYGYRGALYGFFSGHSANYTAVATLLCLIFRDRRFTGIIALLVGWVIYSRMYLGAHFLSDCLVGILVGLSVGYAVYQIYLSLRLRLLNRGHRPPEEVFHSGIGYFSYALWCTIPIVLMMALQVERIVRMVTS